MVSILEKHVDGSWWYHPGDTYDSLEMAKKGYQEFWGKHHPERPVKFFEHEEPLNQEMATCTLDFKVFHFWGKIFWPKSRKGELLKS